MFFGWTFDVHRDMVPNADVLEEVSGAPIAFFLIFGLGCFILVVLLVSVFADCVATHLQRAGADALLRHPAVCPRHLRPVVLRGSSRP